MLIMIWKSGGYLHNTKIIRPDSILDMDFEAIVIASMSGLESITKQLKTMGIADHLIDDSYVIGSLESRRIFLENFATFCFDKTAEVAEAGVFEGDFAKWINRYFSDRTLHLFDTFEGFNSRDVTKEDGLSNIKAGDYNNTSEEIVMCKMCYPERVIVYRGHFPETARNIDAKFCFVNLDMDLYEPTYQGLKFFASKMVRNRVILIHDYYSKDFYGPRKAVDEFI